MGKILIVDDDPDILLSVEASLSSGGYQVLVTTEPSKVPRLLDEHVVDAVVLDVMMPETSGMDVLDTIRSRPGGKLLPVLLLSALGETEDKVKGFRAGADDYLVKPFKPVELLARIERMVSRRSQGSGLNGRLESFPLADLLQNLAQGRKTGCLELAGERGVARLYFEGGQIVGSSVGQLQTRDASLALLELQNGHFFFESRAVEDDERDLHEGEGLSLSGLLLEAAWLQDELQERVSRLPSPGDSIFAVAPFSGEVPSEFSELPFDAVYREIGASPGIDLEALVGVELASPSRIQLALALMMEQGVVRAAPPENSRQQEDAATDGDSLARLVADCEQRGIGADEPVHLLILFQPEVWDRLFALLTAVSAELMTEHQRRILLDQLSRRHHGAVPVSLGQRKVFFNLQPLPKTGEQRREFHLPMLAGVVLWLLDRDWDADLDSLVADVEATARRSSNVILLPEGAPRDRVEASLAALRTWRVATGAPRDLHGLARVMTAAPRENPAPAGRSS